MLNNKAIIFDMDGVLIDSMIYHCRAWQDASKLYDVHISKEDIYLHEGEKAQRSIQFFLKQNGKPILQEIINLILQEKERIFSKIANTHVYPSIPRLLEYLSSQHIPLALVTGTSSTELKKVLSTTIANYFPIKITGEQVQHGKPHPEPYLMALDRLNITASEAVVIENAPFGIRSAKSAGIYCIALCTSLAKQHLTHADLVLESPQKLYELITAGNNYCQ